MKTFTSKCNQTKWPRGLSVSDDRGQTVSFFIIHLLNHHEISLFLNLKKNIL